MAPYNTNPEVVERDSRWTDYALLIGSTQLFMKAAVMSLRPSAVKNIQPSINEQYTTELKSRTMPLFGGEPNFWRIILEEDSGDLLLLQTCMSPGSALLERFPNLDPEDDFNPFNMRYLTSSREDNLFKLSATRNSNYFLRSPAEEGDEIFYMHIARLKASAKDKSEDGVALYKQLLLLLDVQNSDDEQKQIRN